MCFCDYNYLLSTYERYRSKGLPPNSKVSSELYAADLNVSIVIVLYKINPKLKLK